MVTHRSLTIHAEQTKRWILIFIFLLTGCNSAAPSPATARPPKATLTLEPLATVSPTGVSDYATRIRNAEYQLGVTDSLRVVQLTDGKYEQGAAGGTDFVSIHVSDFVASGDLNNDGIPEVVALIAENYGGTGVFTFLAVYADVNGALVFQTSAYVDDRPGLDALAVENGEIFLEAVLHTAEDPFCCPTLRMTRHYLLLSNNQLDIIDYATFTPAGKPRTITIDTPVNGTESYSSIQFRGSVTIAPFENNLVYRIYDLGGVELAAGSINVKAAELGGPGTFDSVISLGTILSGTVIRVEVQDISAADGSLFAMDSVELVVK